MDWLPNPAFHAKGRSANEVDMRLFSIRVIAAPILPAFLAGLLVGCTPEDDDESDDTGSDLGTDCGEPTTYDVSFEAKVVDDQGRGVAGIRVALDDRGYTATELGEGTTGGNGEVKFTAVGVTSLPDCWGTLLDYWLVATDPADASRSAEDDMNTQLFNAIDDGSLSVDAREFPLIVP